MCVIAANNIHYTVTRSRSYIPFSIYMCVDTCGILAEPKELVEDSESLRAAVNVVALIGGLSTPWRIFTVEGEGGWRA